MSYSSVTNLFLFPFEFGYNIVIWTFLWLDRFHFRSVYRHATRNTVKKTSKTDKHRRGWNKKLCWKNCGPRHSHNTHTYTWHIRSEKIEDGMVNNTPNFFFYIVFWMRFLQEKRQHNTISVFLHEICVLEFGLRS